MSRKRSAPDQPQRSEAVLTPLPRAPEGAGRPAARAGPKVWFDGLSKLVLAVGMALLIGALAYRVLLGLPLNFGAISLEQFVSVALALFSIFLSWAFFVKANEMSDRFYVKMFEFFRENSVSLGAIEAGFGEKLTNIERRFEKPSDIAEGFEALKLTYNEGRAAEQERWARFEKVIDGLKLPNTQKEQLSNAVRESSDAVASDKEAISRRIATLEEAVERTTEPQAPVLNFIRAKVIPAMREKLALIGEMDPDDERLSAVFEEVSRNFTRVFLANMRDLGFAEPGRGLTEDGLKLLRSLLKDP